MALNKNQLENLLNMISARGGSQKQLPSLPLSESQKMAQQTSNISQQRINATARLQNVGVDTSNIEDPRGPLEKALNLPDEQNFLFDILEIINRPQQAIFGGIIEGMEEGKLFSAEGAKRGFTGEELYYGGDIVRKTLNLEDKEGVDWTDWVGFGLDVFLDPADIGLALITGGGSVAAQAAAQVVDLGADVAKVADAASDAAKALNAGAAAIDAGADSIKYLKQGKVLNPTGLAGLAGDIVFGKGNKLYIPKDAKEYIKLLTDKKYRQLMGIEKVSVTGAIFKTGTFAAKGSFGFADGVLEHGLSKMDETLYGSYKAMKNTFGEAFKNVSGNIKRVGSAAKQRLYQGFDTFQARLGNFSDDLVKLADGKPIETFSENAFNYAEFVNRPNKILKKGDFIDFILKEQSPMISFSDESLATLNKWFGDDVIKTSTDIIEDSGDKFIAFKKDYWTNTNKDLQKLLAEGKPSVKALGKEKIKDYEIALKNKDPKAYDEYIKIKNAEDAVAVDGVYPEGSIKEQVEYQLQERYRKSGRRIVDTDPQVIRDRASIEREIRRANLSKNLGAEAFLRKNIKDDDVAKVILNEADVSSKVNRLNVTDKVAYEQTLAEEMAQINRTIEQAFPSKAKELSPQQLAQYNKRRNAFAFELKKDPSNFSKSQGILNSALANPSPDDLLDFRGIGNLSAEEVFVEEVDNAVRFFGESKRTGATITKQNLKYLPKELQDDIKNVYKKANKIKTDKIRNSNIKKGLQKIYRDYIAKLPQNLLSDAEMATLAKTAPTGATPIARTFSGSQQIAIDKFDSVSKTLQSSTMLKDPSIVDNLLEEAGKIAKGSDNATFVIEATLSQMGDDVRDFIKIGLPDDLTASMKSKLPQSVQVAINKYNSAISTIDDLTDFKVTSAYNSLKKAFSDYTNLSKEVYLLSDIAKSYGKTSAEVRNALSKSLGLEVSKARGISSSIDSGSQTFAKLLGIGEELAPIQKSAGVLLEELTDDVLYPKDPTSTPVQASFAPQPKLYDDVVSEDTISIGKFYTKEQLAAFEIMAQDPSIVKAAERFMDEIRWVQEYIGKAEFNDARALIDASMEGYATHTLSESSRDIVKRIREQFKISGASEPNFLPGNISELSSRAYDMSAAEANRVRKIYNKYLFSNDDWFIKNVPDEAKEMVTEFFNQDLFSVNAKESIIGLMDDKFRALNRNNSTIDMLAAMSFGDPNGNSAAIKSIKKNAKPPVGFTTITAGDKSRLKKVFNQVKQYSKESYYIDSMLKVLEGKADVAIEKHLYELIGLGDKSAEAGWKALDKFNSLFKALKTSNPVGFNARNFIGNNFNMWASGVSVPDIVRYWNRSMDYFGKYFKGDNAIQKIVAEKGVEALSPQQLKIHETMTALMKNGYFDMEQLYKLTDIEEFRSLKKLVDEGKTPLEALMNNPLLEINMKMNLWTDNRARTALYMYALDNPAYARKLGIEGFSEADSAMKSVRMVLFDPNDLSLWEEKWMKRLIPFYTFTRQNLAFQMTNLSKNSEKYYRLYKAMNSLYNAQDIDVREMNQFERDQFYIPFIGQKDGKYISIKTGFPINDLIELIEDPLQRVTSAVTPMLRAPFEIATGTSAFTGRPIQQYEGEMSKNIPFLDKRSEYLLSQLGIDVPVRTATGALDVVTSLAQGQAPELSEVGRATGLVYEGDMERTQLAKQYEKLNALNDKIRALKASGKEVPTIDEIARARSGVSDANARRMAQLQQIMDMMSNKKR